MVGLVLISSARLSRSHFQIKNLLNSYRAGAHCNLITLDISALYSDVYVRDFFVTIQNSITRNVFITVFRIRVRISTDSDCLDPNPGKEGKTDRQKCKNVKNFSCFEVCMLLRKPGQWTSYKETPLV